MRMAEGRNLGLLGSCAQPKNFKNKICSVQFTRLQDYIGFNRPSLTYNDTHKAPSPSTTRADVDSWAVDRAFSLLEVWALVAAFSGLVGAWRLLGVCRAARAGAKEFLGTLPRLVVCGGYSSAAASEVWGLDLAMMRWEAVPALLCSRARPACCAVRGTVVVLGGLSPGGRGLVSTSRVEMLSKGEGAFVELPPLSCGAISGAAAIAVDESHSALGQVLLLGGMDQDHTLTSSVRLVDLATGVCTPQADLDTCTHARILRRRDGQISASPVREAAVDRRPRWKCGSRRCRAR